MAEKVTVMVLKVDLQCPCCYKKVKKILCKFPQITDQVYDEKANTVTITVVCCNPEKIRDKLCCKGAKIIKSIEIKEPPQPPKSEKTKKPPPNSEPSKAPQPVPTQNPSPTQPPPERIPTFYGYPPERTCCGPCSEGYGGGPCYFGYGTAPPPPPQPHFEGYYGYGYHERPCHVTRCDYYFNNDNPQACSIM